MKRSLESLSDELRSLENRGLHRSLLRVDGPSGAHIEVNGRAAINFSSNNYLDLANAPSLREAMSRTLGFGAGGSRLIVGNLAEHRAFERQLCDWKKTESALLFNSGYHANVGAVTALAGPEDAIFSDSLNHASLIDGARLSRAALHVYRHNDADHLESLLREHRRWRRALILTESLFSMDGDRAPLADLTRLASEHEALLIVDEAHAVGVFGESGQGLSTGQADLQIGTLGKALGGFGAYAAGAAPIIELLINRARSFIFTTALPAPVVAAGAAAVAWVRSPLGAARRAQLHDLTQQVHNQLREYLPLADQPSHIIPLRLRAGDPTAAMTVSARLLDRGIFAQGIRPPTVPDGTSRIRLSLMATHTSDDIAKLLSALKQERDFFV